MCSRLACRNIEVMMVAHALGKSSANRASPAGHACMIRHGVTPNSETRASAAPSPGPRTSNPSDT